MNKALDFITSILTIVAAITAVALRYAGLGLAVPIVDGQYLVEVEVQAMEFVFRALVLSPHRAPRAHFAIARAARRAEAVLVLSAP